MIKPRALRLPRTDPLESEIEAKVRKYAEQRGLYQRKFVSPAHRSVPDRLFIAKGPALFFIEFKRKGKKATPEQDREHERIRSYDVPVFVVDTVELGKFIVDMFA